MGVKGGMQKLLTICQAWGVIVNSLQLLYEAWHVYLGSFGYFNLVCTPRPRLDFFKKKYENPFLKKELCQTP